MSKNEDKQSTPGPGGAPQFGIVMEDCHDNQFSNTLVEATHTGVTMRRSSGNTFDDLSVVAPGTLEKITEIKERVKHLQLDEKLKEYITEHLNIIEKSKSPQDRWAKYLAFMSGLEVHIAVLGPIYSAIEALAPLLQLPI